MYTFGKDETFGFGDGDGGESKSVSQYFGYRSVFFVLLFSLFIDSDCFFFHLQATGSRASSIWLSIYIYIYTYPYVAVEERRGKETGLNAAFLVNGFER